jgi:hypothetical protein
MIIINANKAPTNDLILRKAIIHGVNKADIIDKELYGFAEPVDALFPKNAPYCDIDLTPRWDYDAQKADLLRCATTTTTTTTTSAATTAAATTAAAAAATTAAAVTPTVVTSVLSGSLQFNSSSLTQTQVEQGVKKALAQHMNVSESVVTATATASRRLQEERRLETCTGSVGETCNTWSVAYTVTVPTSQVSAVQTKANELQTNPTNFNQILKTSLVSLGVSESAATVDISSSGATVTTVTSGPTGTNNQNTNDDTSGVTKCRLTFLAFSMVALVMRR